MIHATFLHPPAWHGATPAVRPGTLLAARAAGTKTRASPRRNRLQHFGALLLWAPALLWSGAQAAAFDQAQIQRPRASFIDVGARMTFLRSGAQDAHLSASLPRASNCRGTDAVLPLPGPMSIPPRYQVGNHGRLHPDYDKAVAVYRRFEDTAARWANAYVASGDAAYADCLVEHLQRWAQAGALMDYQVSSTPGASNQAWYQAEWSIAAAALALSQVIGEPTLNRQRVDAVIAWLHQASLKQISYPGGHSTCCNNHAYWRGLHATMVGVLANDASLYRWGLGRYALAMDQLAADGRWALEMARKEQSLHYQNFALLPLVLIAEIAAQQGLDLYAHRSGKGQDLHGAIDFLAAMVANPQREAALGLTTQDRRAFVPGRGDQAWGEFYRARFGRDPLGLLSEPTFNARTGGSATLLVYKAPGAATHTTRIDLQPWKLQLPDRQASDVGPAHLMRGFRSPYFEIESGGSLLFTAPVGGGLTATAKYTRSELREMLDPADKARNWPLQGRHTMSLRQEVVQAPRSGRVVVFQIHAIQPNGGAAPPLVKAQWRDDKIQFLVKAQAAGGKDIVYEVPDVPLNKAYDAGLVVEDGTLTMRLNGVTLSDDFAARDPGWRSLRFYFKAGNYPQDKEVGDGRNISLVRIHALKVSHE